MLRRLTGLNCMGELSVLSGSECEQVAASLQTVRSAWVPRSPRGDFLTLGMNSYMDLAAAADPEQSYFGRVVRQNALLWKHFRATYELLADRLSEALALPVKYPADLALPGFHLWTSTAIPQHATASVHFDLQYRPILDREPYAGATGTVSYTLPIVLPAAGSSLRVWPEITYPCRDVEAKTRTIEPRTICYTPGVALVHSGNVLHQIGMTDPVHPNDIRIMLQGHGLIVDDEVSLYW